MADTSNGLDRTRPVQNVRWFPLAGLAVGLVYLLIMQFAGTVFGDPSREYPFTLHPLAYTGPAEGLTCNLVPSAGPALADQTIISGYGVTPKVVAIRLQDSPEDPVLVFHALPDKAALLACDEAARTAPLLQMGDFARASDRAIATPRIAFPLPTPSDSTVYLVHIRQDAALAFPLSVESRAAFLSDSDQRLKVHIGFTSVICFMVLYNFLLSVFTQQPAFIFNALTVASLLLQNLVLTGLGPLYIWPNWPALTNILVDVSLAGATLFAPFYAYRFIVPQDQSLLAAKPWLLIWPAVSAGMLLTLFVLPYHYMTLPLVLWWITFTIVCLTQLVQSARRGNPRAAVLLAAVLGAIVPAMVAGSMVSFFGYDFGNMTPHLTELALLFEATLFTLALAYQIRLSRWREMEALTELNQHSLSAKRQLLDTIDSDRTRLASDLHDSAGQMLGLISSRLKKAALSDSLETGQQSELRDTAALASDTLAEIRRISHELHPATLTHLGLRQAIVVLCDASSDAGHVRIDHQLKFDADLLDDQQNLQIYRIFQELIANTMRHSGASDAMVSLSSAGQRFQMSFSDNGQTSGTPDRGSGIGRTILRERVARLGGDIRIKDGPLGSVITIDFPAQNTRTGGET